MDRSADRRASRGLVRHRAIADWAWRGPRNCWSARVWYSIVRNMAFKLSLPRGETGVELFIVGTTHRLDGGSTTPTRRAMRPT